MTPPPPPPPITTTTTTATTGNNQAAVVVASQQLHFQQQLQRVQANATTSNIAATINNSDIQQNSEDAINIEAIAITDDAGDVDVVDGLLPRRNNRQQQQQQQQQQSQQQHFYHQNQHAGYQQLEQQQFEEYHHHHQQYEHEALKLALDGSGGDIAPGTAAAAYYAKNNNLVYCDPSPADEATTTMTPVLDELHFGVPATVVDDDAAAVIEIDEDMVYELSQRLQAELRAAKSRHLACTEVSLPWDLTPRIAREILTMSEREPCGVRGCSIFIEFEDEPNNTR